MLAAGPRIMRFRPSHYLCHFNVSPFGIGIPVDSAIRPRTWLSVNLALSGCCV